MNKYLNKWYNIYLIRLMQWSFVFLSVLNDTLQANINSLLHESIHPFILVLRRVALKLLFTVRLFLLEILLDQRNILIVFLTIGNSWWCIGLCLIIVVQERKELYWTEKYCSIWIILPQFRLKIIFYHVQISLIESWYLTLSLLGYLKTRICWGGVNLTPPL